MSEQGVQKINQPQKKDRVADEIIAWFRGWAVRKVNSRLWDERRQYPPYVITDFANHGIFAMNIPKQYGGLALDSTQILAILEQIAAVDLSLATLVTNNNFLGIHPIVGYATDALKKEYLPKFARGRLLVSYALTEPAAGSNPMAIKGTATMDGPDAWRINATKIWIGSAAWAGGINVFVNLNDPRSRERGITGFFVDTDSEGLEMGPELLTMGMRGMVQNKFTLRDVRVTRRELLGSPGKGFEAANDAMMFTRLAFAATFLGSMKRCSQLMLRYASRRKSIVTGRLLDNPVTLHKMGEIASMTAALQALIETASHFFDRGVAVPGEMFIVAKVAGSEFLWQAADDLVQIMGGRGYLENNIAPQIMRDARVARIFEGPSEALLSYLGSKVLKQNDELLTFIRTHLGQEGLAKQLEEIAGQIRESLVKTRNKSIHWANYQAGETASRAILYCALRYKSTGRPDPGILKHTAWAEERFRAAAAAAVSENCMADRRFSADEITEEVHRYTAVIDDIEQTLADELRTLDPYLKKDFDPDKAD